MQAFEHIYAHRKNVNLRDQDIFEKLVYPNICIPNRSLAWSLSCKGEGYDKIKEIKKDIREYNGYIELLCSLDNFKKEFVENHYNLRRDKTVTLWGEKVAEVLFNLRRYPFETCIQINGDWLFASDAIPSYEITVESKQIYFEVGATDGGYPSESADGKHYFIWNWADDYRDFCFYLWEIFERQGWIPDSYDEEEQSGNVGKSYSGFECYAQHRECMNGPDVNLWRCAQILIDANYLKVYELHPEKEDPWWNLRGTANKTITLGILDKSFLKNKVQGDKLKMTLRSTEDEIKSHKYILLGINKRPYFSNNRAQYGGNYKQKIYGRLDCPSAKQFIKKGKYVQQRVFFKDEATAVATGFRPCAICMPKAYAKWKTLNKKGGS